MSNNLDQREERGVSPERDSTFALIISMADTTWRMFTPPAILVAGGIFTDLKLGTKPWITFLSAVAGLGFSVLLVKRQLRNTR
jgi:hypothetical protein